MSRRPIISRNIAADRASVERALGAALGKRYLPTSAIAEYAYVLRFPGSKVVTSQRLGRVLKKLLQESTGGAILLAGNFTVEALTTAAQAGCCDVVSEREPFWTDARYLASRGEPH